MSLTQWLSNNLLGLITLIAYVLAQCILVARSMWLTRQTADQVRHIEKLLAEHMNSHTLHRTPDFEERLKQWDRVLDEIRNDVKKILERGNGKGAQ